jgi:hypothetical protein
MYRNGKDKRKKRNVTGFVFVLSVGEKFPTAEF